MTLRGTNKPHLGEREWREVGGLPGDATISVRLEWDNADERVVTREVVVRAGATGRVTSDQLQRIPIATLERLINAHQDEIDRKTREMWARQLPPLARVSEDTADDFAGKVAEHYKVFSALSRSPAKEMALHSNVPVSRVHRWVREARKLGKLPPGRQGTAG